MPTPEELQVLRVLRDRDGSATLRDIIEAIEPGAMSAPNREFARRSVPMAVLVGKLHRAGFVTRAPMTFPHVLTEAGRAALDAAEKETADADA